MQIADLRFLVVEDNEFQRRWLLTMLSTLGANHIVEAADGLEALNILQNGNQAIDISIIDLRMPGMDGMELIRHMSKEGQLSSIILASALAPSLIFSARTMSKAYGVNLLGSIEKPATPEALLALINLHQSLRHQPPKTFIPPFTFEEIQQALNNKDFDLLFQPRVDLESGQIKGVEAFARWRHPQYGVMLPDAFIPLLEKNGVLDMLDWLIFEKSVSACQAWQKQGFSIAVSINISPSSLGNPRFSEKIIEFISRQDIEPDRISFEIAESSAIKNVPHVLENLVRLRMHGFGVSIENCGIGQSSMQELLRIPFSELKFDRSFILGARQNPSLEIVLNLSVEFCRKLRQHSAAAGVETRQEWDFLLDQGCHYAQGYYIAKPMEADCLPAWMKEWSDFF